MIWSRDADEGGERALKGWEIPEEVGAEAWTEKRRAAASLRALLDRFVESDADAETFRAIHAQAEAMLGELAAQPSSKSGELFKSGAFFERHLEMKDRSVMVGLSNPVSPVIRVTREGEKVIGRLSLDARYSGAPGFCHGGIVATVLDEILGHAAIVNGYGVVTQSLTVRYLRPTLLERETYCEAHIREVKGDRVVCVGDLYVDGKRTASAQGVFVDVKGERFQKIFTRAHEG
jgi:acyl-coenzyme A thioesterase PaaI-like protein